MLFTSPYSRQAHVIVQYIASPYSFSECLSLQCRQLNLIYWSLSPLEQSSASKKPFFEFTGKMKTQNIISSSGSGIQRLSVNFSPCHRICLRVSLGNVLPLETSDLSLNTLPLALILVSYAWYSDKLRMWSPFILFGLIMCLVGFSINISQAQILGDIFLRGRELRSLSWLAR